LKSFDKFSQLDSTSHDSEAISKILTKMYCQIKKDLEQKKSKQDDLVLWIEEAINNKCAASTNTTAIYNAYQDLCLIYEASFSVNKGKVLKLGGLHVIGTERHESIVSLMNTLQIEDNIPIESKVLSSSLNNAQKKVESYYYDIRKQLFEYDEVLNSQRQAIYAERNRILSTLGIAYLNMGKVQLMRLYVTTLLMKRRKDITV